MELRERWTWLVWFVRSVSKGAWHRCRRCQKFSECYSYGEGVMSHRAQMERLVGRQHPMPAVPGTYASWLVCINCCTALNVALGTHDGCLCRELAGQRMVHRTG